MKYVILNTVFLCSFVKCVMSARTSQGICFVLLFEIFFLAEGFA